MIVTIPTPLRPRKVGNSMVVTIPADICEQLAIDGETLLQVTIEPVEQVTIPRLDPGRAGGSRSGTETDQAALRHLRGH